jgi:hypothetical protein
MRGDRSPRASDFWINSTNLSFAEIVNGSNCRRLYVEYQHVLSNDVVKTSILKPINDYAYNLYPAPDFIRYEDGCAYLRQRTHAEILIRKNYKDGLYFLDRPWIRQFYPSAEQFKSDNSFLVVHKAYCPWFIDLDIEYEVLQVEDEYTPFIIKPDTHKMVDTNSNIIEPNFVHFLIKKTGEHMIDPGHGKISIGTPIYDIKIRLSHTEYEKLIDFYHRYNNR